MLLQFRTQTFTSLINACPLFVNKNYTNAGRTGLNSQILESPCIHLQILS